MVDALVVVVEVCLLVVPVGSARGRLVGVVRLESAPRRVDGGHSGQLPQGGGRPAGLGPPAAAARPQALGQVLDQVGTGEAAVVGRTAAAATRALRIRTLHDVMFEYCANSQIFEQKK